MTDEPNRPPFRGQIQAVRGRDTADPERGLPRVSEISLDVGDGRVVSAAVDISDSANLVTAVGVAAINSGRFPICPICLDADPATLEHVPPGAFGGIGMTWTCRPCNNGLGSRTESAMQDWFDDAHRIRLTATGLRKPLTEDRVLVRRSATGEVLFILDRPDSGESILAEHLQPGFGGEMNLISPSPAEYMTGLLKSAYLAVCLHLRGVPDAPFSVDIRTELLAARDAPRRRDVTLGPRAEALGAYRTNQPASGPPLALLRTNEEEHPRYVISLAGTVIVDWPFPDVSPFTDAV